MIERSGTYQLQPQTRSAVGGIGSEPRQLYVPSVTYEQIEAAQGLFRQITYSLSVLSSAAELTHHEEGHAIQNIRIWLQPSARQAEEALHQLRELRMPQSPALMDLIQSLTVLVLAADMLGQGQIESDFAAETFGLMRRNAERAMGAMLELRNQLSNS
jgi:hypothetical protein